MKRVAAIALGSNLASRFGDRDANLREAIRRARELGDLRAVSRFYDTAPVGMTEQPRFLNAAMLLETELEPVELMRALLAIERAMGRERSAVAAKGPRVIDLDLLLMDDVVIPAGRVQAEAEGGGAEAGGVQANIVRAEAAGGSAETPGIGAEAGGGGAEAVGLQAEAVELTLPHPAMAHRRFVLEPLAEIAPKMVDPLSGRTIEEMLTGLAI